MFGIEDRIVNPYATANVTDIVWVKIGYVQIKAGSLQNLDKASCRLPLVGEVSFWLLEVVSYHHTPYLGDRVDFV